MKYILSLIPLIVVGAIISIWIHNAHTLREVTKLEQELKTALEKQEKLEKELDKKIIYYDSHLDLSKIKGEMENKGMVVANEIVYFEIEE